VQQVTLRLGAEPWHSGQRLCWRYANSKYWADFEDVSFYRMEIVDVYYVGGIGVLAWVTASEYSDAQPDPLADAMAGIIEHMNAGHERPACAEAFRHRGRGGGDDLSRPHRLSAAIKNC